MWVVRVVQGGRSGREGPVGTGTCGIFEKSVGGIGSSKQAWDMLHLDQRQPTRASPPPSSAIPSNDALATLDAAVDADTVNWGLEVTHDDRLVSPIDKHATPPLSGADESGGVPGDGEAVESSSRPLLNEGEGGGLLNTAADLPLTNTARKSSPPPTETAPDDLGTEKKDTAEEIKDEVMEERVDSAASSPLSSVPSPVPDLDQTAPNSPEQPAESLPEKKPPPDRPPTATPSVPPAVAAAVPTAVLPLKAASPVVPPEAQALSIPTLTESSPKVAAVLTLNAELIK